MPKPRVVRHAVVQPQDQSIRLIPLTQDQNAIVDAADYEWLCGWNWHAHRDNKNQKFYAQRMSMRKMIYMHQAIANRMDGEEVDHRNGNTLDNRRVNLRRCSRAQNQRNRGKQANNTSGFKGVIRDNRRDGWQAQIRVNGRCKYLGLFQTPQEAAVAYQNAAKKFFGDFACTTSASNI